MTIREFDGIRPEIADGVFVDDMALVVGDVTLGRDSSIWPMAVLRGDVNQIRIGERSNIQDGSVLHVTHAGPLGKGRAMIVGDDVTVGHNAVLHACTIEDSCLIGMSATVLDGAVIRKHVIVGAGSLVPPNKELQSGYLYLGNPVSQIRKLTDKEIEYFKYSAEHYVRLQQRHQQHNDE
ncbi:MAG: gamma carbonic anhydrase family protein [Gammaproteobacteria bacterium]|nr:gamma carbonic anhydrase family protein [Gammaproteobacteria bacterium]